MPGPKMLDGIMDCTNCGSSDTKAIIGDNDTGIIWCSCGAIDITVNDGMHLTVDVAVTDKPI